MKSKEQLECRGQECPQLLLFVLYRYVLTFKRSS